MLLRNKISEMRKYFKLISSRFALPRINEKRIGYIGGEGHFNLGDDAMFQGARYLLPKKYSLLSYDHPVRETRLSMLGLGGKKYFSQVILGGGTLITPPGHRGWLLKAIHAVNSGIPIWSLGTGIGSCGFTQPEGEIIEEWIRILPYFEKIGVRGPRSKAKLSCLGISKVVITGDLGLALTVERLISPSSRPKISINLSLPHNESFDDYPVFVYLCDAIEKLDKKGYQIVPIIMEPTDIFPIRSLIQALSLDVKLERCCSPNDFFDKVADCWFSICVRLHAAVLSHCVGVPSLKIAYREKCWDFMESVSAQDWCISIEENRRAILEEKIGTIAEQSRKLRPKVLAQAHHWKEYIQNYIIDMTIGA